MKKQFNIIITVKDISKLGLNINDVYRLSWDDLYLELCEEQGVERFNEVTFDKPMPIYKNTLDKNM